jgi:hypothetical protein
MSLFDEEDTKLPKEPTPITNAEELATKLAEIKNEKGEVKYGSLEVALEALKESQNYIPTLKSEKEKLEAELSTLKAKAEKSENVEEVVARLLEKSKPQEPTHQQEKGIDENDVAAIVERKLDETKQEEVFRLNEEMVTKALNEKFGEKAKEEIAKKAAELGTTPKQLGAIATENPKMVISLFNNEPAKQVTPPTNSDVNTQFFQKAPEEKLKAPEKSVLSGASSDEQKAHMLDIKKAVYEKFNVET